jgi:hypothetical protein
LPWGCLGGELEKPEGCEILELVEGRFAGLIHGNDLAVDDGFVYQFRHGGCDGGMALREILAVARPQVDPAGCPEGDGTVSVQLELVEHGAPSGGLTVGCRSIGSTKRARSAVIPAALITSQNKDVIARGAV